MAADDDGLPIDWTPGPPVADDLDDDCLIDYVDYRGEISLNRRVTVRTLYGVHEQGVLSVTYFKGFCHRRGEDRTFRADRVHRLADVETGHSFVSPTAIAAWFAIKAGFI